MSFRLSAGPEYGGWEGVGVRVAVGTAVGVGKISRGGVLVGTAVSVGEAVGMGTAVGVTVTATSRQPNSAKTIKPKRKIRFLKTIAAHSKVHQT